MLFIIMKKYLCIGHTSVASCVAICMRRRKAHIMCVENVISFASSSHRNTTCLSLLLTRHVFFIIRPPFLFSASPSLLSTHFLSAVILPVSLLLGKISGAVCIQSRNKDYWGDLCRDCLFYLYITTTT